jgi:hypothetical protein
LTILSSSLAWYPPWTPDHYFNCFEWDEVPVDARMAFRGDYCQDKVGNKYHVSVNYDDPAQQTSCCQCLEYTCRPVLMCPMCPMCGIKGEEEECKKCEDKRKRPEGEQKELISKNEFYVYWNTTVSDNCCLYCNNTVYKADTVIDTTQLEDRCESEETHVCRKIPGLEKAKIETEFRYGVCCNDDVGLQTVETMALQPSTCSERECIRPKNAPFAVWISKPYKKWWEGYEPELKGCDCCKVYDEKLKWILIEDKAEITIDDETFECCRGDLVKKVEILPEKKKEKKDPK